MKNTKIYLLLFLFLVMAARLSWAYPNLRLDSSDIHFSNNYPDLNEGTTIWATIHNSSDAYSNPVFTQSIEPFKAYYLQYYNQWLAQSFYYEEDVNLTGVSLCIRDLGTNDSLTVTIETDDPTHEPSGDLVVLVASTTVNSGSSFEWVDFMFSTSTLIPLEANTTYWIVAQNYTVEYDTYNGYGWLYADPPEYPNGNFAYTQNQRGSWNPDASFDMLFKAYRSTTTVVRFYDGDPDYDGTLIGTDTIPPVPDKGSRVAYCTWKSTPPGYRDIYVYVNQYNVIVESDTANNKAYKTIYVDFPRVISAKTIDDNLNGCIDAYYIVFNEGVNVPDPAGFTVKGHDIIGVFTTLENHPDELDNDEIYLCFTESADPDTGSLPQIIYSSTTGKVTDLDGYPLLDIGEEDIREIDGTSPVVDSLRSFPRDGALGIPVDASIKIIFAEQMDVYTTTSAIKVEAIVNKDGQRISEVVSGSFSVSYDTKTCQHKFIFKPVPPLKNNYTYVVTIDTTATDIIGHHLTTFQFTFTTISNCNESNTFVPVPDDGKMRIILDAGTLKEDFSVKISTFPLEDSQKETAIINANNKLDIDDDPFSFALESTIVEIKAFYADGNPIIDTFEIPATITLSYEDSDQDGFVEETLKVYWLNESHSLWVKLSGSKVDTSSNRVSADTFHFSIFSLHGVGTTDLSDAYAFPVPFIPSRGDTDITFTEISPLCTIKIYTLNGELVRTIEHTSRETSHSWDDVTNDRGDRLASGVYLYIIKNDKGKKKGKLIIIR
ncbi:hypothetical protein ES707_02442 [subsurface metagenome]